MKKLFHLTLAILAIMIIPVVGYAHLPTSVDGKAVPSLAPMLSKVTPSVVNILVEKELPQQQYLLDQNKQSKPSQPSKMIGVGSGIIFNAKKGYIITNAHVVKDQRIMVVTLKDGRRYRAKLIGEDEGYDIAVIQIKAKHLQQMPVGNSSQLKVGDFVVAVGSPFGLTQTVTSGVISALNRSSPPIEGFQNFIQTDAPINPGNSGGALIDMEGKLIGINTAIVTPNAGSIGIGFAIPSDMAASVANQLIKYGKVKRGMLGVLTQNITPELADALHLKHDRGAMVTQIIPNSPAEKAGLQAEDVIESVNESSIRNSEQLRNMLGIIAPGTNIKISVLRDHQEKMLTATVGNPKTIQMQRELPFLGGMRLQKFSDLEADGTIIKGVLVISVSDTSNGAMAGLIPGDVILSANGTSVPTVNELINVAESKPDQMLLKVSRGTGQLFLVLQNNS